MDSTNRQALTLIQHTPIDRSQRLTVDTKKYIINMINKQFNERLAECQQEREAIEEAVWKEWKKEAGYKEIIRKIAALDKKKQQIVDQRHALEETLSRYNISESGSRIFVSTYDNDKEKVATDKKITERIEERLKKKALAGNIQDKLCCRVQLASKVEDILPIVAAVLGNQIIPME